MSTPEDRVASRILAEAAERVRFDRDPDVMGGAACLGGTRIPVFFICDEYHRGGMTSALMAFPGLTAFLVRACDMYYSRNRYAVNADREDYAALVPADVQ